MSETLPLTDAASWSWDDVPGDDCVEQQHDEERRRENDSERQKRRMQRLLLRRDRASEALYRIATERPPGRQAAKMAAAALAMVGESEAAQAPDRVFLEAEKVYLTERLRKVKAELANAQRARARNARS